MANDDYVWLSEIRRLVNTGHIHQALAKIDSIESSRGQLELFRSEVQVEREEKLLWLYRVRVLQRAKRLREALAWTCLECYLNPEGVTAQAVRDELFALVELRRSLRADDPDATPPDSSWSDIAGMDELKLILEQDVILPLMQKELYQKFRIHLPNGILLYGPPGCGKTFFARHVANRIGWNFIDIQPSNIASPYVHGTQEAIAEKFGDAIGEAPTVMFFDEIDAMIPRRDETVGHHYASESNEFLAQLNECHEKEVLVIGATNRPYHIDSAALRPGRFDRLVYVGPPDEPSRESLFRHYLSDRPLAEAIDFERLSKETAGYSCADIENVVNIAANIAVRAKQLIGTGQLFTALEQVPASIRDEDLESHREFRQQRGGV